MRLDHPDWGDVRKTTYKTGVITDFKQVEMLYSYLSPNVESMVKVEIEGQGETLDYIPIFCHPKELYWDGYGASGGPYDPNRFWQGNAKATDFDEVQKCHTRAWLSYRIGDEVIVMMRPLVEGGVPEPVAVIGHADGVPRIGESVVKVECGEALNYFRADLEMADHPQKENGLDGLDLGLKTKWDRKVLEANDYSGYANYSNIGLTFEKAEYTIAYTGTVVRQPDYFNYFIGKTFMNYSVSGIYTSTYKHKRAYVTSKETKERYLGMVGPYMYWIEGYSLPAEIWTPAEYDTTTSRPITIEMYGTSQLMVAYDVSFWATHPDYPMIVAIMEQDLIDSAAAHAAWVAYWTGMNSSASYDVVFDYPEGNQAFTYIGEKQVMWLYSPELYEEALAAQEAPAIMENCGGVYAEADDQMVEGAIYSRPHTKTELMEAGMWP